MNANTRHSLIAATVHSGDAVVTKSASTTEAQAEVLDQAWPSAEEGMTKKATLCRMLATGLMVAEAEEG